MREWTTLKDLCVNKGIQTGPFGSQLHQSDYSLDGTPVIMPVNLADGGVSEEKIARVSDEHVERLARHKVREGDLVYARRGDVGRASLIGLHEGGWLCGTGCLRATPDPNKVDSRYLFYLMSQPDVIGWFVNHAKGTTMLNLNTEILSRVPLLYEQSLEQQKRIAGILSAYDKLIENNRRQIALLEEAAQRLYKEWFVDLRFPGYETTPIIDGLPEGWRKGKLDEIVEFRRGKTITQNETLDGNVPVVAGGLQPAYYHARANTTSPVITVSGSGANAGFCRLYTTEIWASDCSFADSSMTDNLYFAYASIKVLSNGFKQCQRGSAQPHVYPKHVNALDVVIPDGVCLSAFNDVAKALYSQIGILNKRVSAAREARDRLLPKLMSGEIEVG